MKKTTKGDIFIIVLTSVLIVIFTVVLIITSSKIVEENKAQQASKATSTTKEEETTVLLSSVFDDTYHTNNFHTKQILGRVVSDDLGINCNMVFDTTDECLRVGAGLHKCSSLPGLKTPMTRSATCPIIAGHCQTNFEGFSKIDPKNGQLPEGLTITLEMPYGDYKYEIVSVSVEKASNFKFSDHRASYGNYEPDIAIFYTCYPFGVTNYVKTDRLFVTCKLIEGYELVNDTLNNSNNSSDEKIANDTK